MKIEPTNVGSFCIYNKPIKTHTMKTQFLVINKFDETYIVDDLDALKSEMYECELETNSLEQINEWFNDTHKVFKVTGEIEELN